MSTTNTKKCCFPAPISRAALLLALIATPISAQVELPRTPFPIGRPDLEETRTVKELRPGLTYVRVERGSWGKDGPPKFSILANHSHSDPELLSPLRKVLEDTGLAVREYQFKASEDHETVYRLSAGEFDNIDEARSARANVPSNEVHESNIAYWPEWQDGPYALNIVIIDPKQYQGKIVSEWSRKAWLASPLELAREHNAVVAINSAFFEYSLDEIAGIPAGISIMQGEWHHENWPEEALKGQRSIIFIGDNEAGVQTLWLGDDAPPFPEFKWAGGKSVKLDGLHRMPKENELVAIKPQVVVTSYLSHGFPKDVLALQIAGDGRLNKGVIYDGGLVIMATGDKQAVLNEAVASNLPVELDLQVADQPGLNAWWTPIVFVRDGVFNADWQSGDPTRRMSQSFIGSDAEGRIYIMSFDGVPYWAPISGPVGGNRTEIVKVLQFLGLTNAAVLDSGGGSSSMAVEGKAVDEPHLEPHSEKRRVAAAVLVIDN